MWVTTIWRAGIPAAICALGLIVAGAATPRSARADPEIPQRASQVRATLTDRGVDLYLRDVLFTSGTAKFEPGASDGLEWLVAFLKEYPGGSVTIEGFTDSRGSRTFNRNLSIRRAQAVLAYLRRRGVDAARLGVTGKGAADPIAANDSAVGRRWNRRVEIVIDDAVVASR